MEPAIGNQSKIAVLGAGSWGTALAILLARQGQATYLWARDRAHIDSMSASRCNQRYLPDIQFPKCLELVADIAEAVKRADDLLIVIPSHGFRPILEQLADMMKPGQRLMWATKGFESGSGKLFHQVVEEVIGSSVSVAVVSGPTFAREVALAYPTAVTIASSNPAYARQMAERFHDDTFRAYTSDDIIGVEVGGAIKNVLAIAAGIADGLGYGANTRAAIITRGLAEMIRLGTALGGRRETFMGLSGLGDLVLTCTDDQSRNRRLGLALGKGKSLEDALSTIDQVVEGVQTAREVHELAVSSAVEMPIAQQVYEVLYENRSPSDAVNNLLSRDLKREMT